MSDDKLISLSSCSSKKTNFNLSGAESSQTSDLISLTSNEEKKSTNIEDNDNLKTRDNDSEAESSSATKIYTVNSDDVNSNLTSPTSIDSDRLMIGQNVITLEGLEITSQNESNFMEGSTPRPPTVDHDMQTSRRPTMFQNVECKYGYHFPTSPTSSMISELAKQVEQASKPSGGKSNILSVDAKASQLKRLQVMFPTATGPIIEQIIKIYNGREGLIKAALISLGYKRAVGDADKQVNTQNAILLMMAKQSSRKLFDKLANYFPDRDENTIKKLMYELKEVEHEIISALVTTSPTKGAIGPSTGRAVHKETRAKSEYVQRQDRDRSNALMKLRFLKTLFPQSDEIDLYHLLYCHNLDAQKVIQELERQGHEPVNINQILATRKSKTQQTKAQQQANRAAKDRAPRPTFVEIHKSRAKQPLNETKVKNLKETIAQQSSSAQCDATTELIESAELSEAQDERELGDDEQSQLKDVVVFPDEVIAIALTAAENDEILAKCFLDEMAQSSDEKYMKRLNLNFESDQQVVLFPCKATQKSHVSDIGLFAAPEFISVPYDIIHSRTALALPKVDASTFTSHDFADAKPTYRLGPERNLAEGPKCYTKRKKLRKILWRPEDEHRLAHGSNYKTLCASTERCKPGELALGANKSLRSSASSRVQRQGHNSKLVQRIHPFYTTKFERIQATN